MNYTICLIGYKGLRFLEIASFYLDIDTIISYPTQGSEAHTYRLIQKVCKEKGINFVKDHRPKIKDIKSDLIFFIGWQYLVSDMDERCIVFHDSLLPKYRGFAPTITALINGDSILGVTALLPVKKADEGPIVIQLSYKVQYPVKLKDIFNTIGDLYLELAHSITIPIKSTIQSNIGATYSIWRDEKDYFIDWTKSNNEIQRLVNATSYPYGGARTYYKKQLIIINDVEIIIQDIRIENQKDMAGKFLLNRNNMPTIVCGSGLLKIKQATFETGQYVYFNNNLRQRLL